MTETELQKGLVPFLKKTQIILYSWRELLSEVDTDDNLLVWLKSAISFLADL